MDFLQMTLVFLMGHMMPSLGRHGHRPMTSEEVNKMLKHYQVIPDVVDAAKNVDQVVVMYNYTIFLDFGTHLIPQQIENPPTSLQWPVFGNQLYSLVVVEPDHPLRQEEKSHQFIHWLVVNIPGTQIEKGETIVEYVGYRSFYEDKKPHRYVYVVYKQPFEEKIVFNETRLIPEQVVERGHGYNFSCRKFAAKHEMGDPVAVNVGFVECKNMWHGRKYKVFKNQTATTEKDLFPEVGVNNPRVTPPAADKLTENWDIQIKD